MYKIVVCDLDETLLSYDKHVSEANISAINKLKDLGIKFIPATGRGYASIQGTLEELGLKDKDNEYTLSYNGGLIIENKNNKVLHLSALDFAQASNIYKKAITIPDICFFVFTKDNSYCYGLYEGERKYLKGVQKNIEIDSDNIDFLKDEKIIKIIFSNENIEYLHYLAKEFEELSNDCEVSYSSNRYLEFNKKGVNKGEGLKIIAKMLNVDIKNTLAIGDNYNDLSMILAAGLGVGVANTVASMKPLCDVISQNDHNHDAIAEIIDRYVLNVI